MKEIKPIEPRIAGIKTLTIETLGSAITRQKKQNTAHPGTK